eukprot:scpid25537/ scgid2107/ 
MADLKARLESVGCPYVRDVDESWIRELLAQPGDARNRMLIWLFVRFDSSLKAIFDAPGARIGDNEAKRILYVSQLFGLCGANDIDLILGKADKSREEHYWNTLVDLVAVSCSASRTGPSSHGDLGSSGVTAGESHVHILSMDQHFKNNCTLMGALCRQADLDVAFPSAVSLFPPDLLRICEQRQAQTSAMPSSSTTAPTTSGTTTTGAAAAATTSSTRSSGSSGRHGPVAAPDAARTAKRPSLPMPSSRELSKRRENLMQEINKHQADLKRLTELSQTQVLFEDASSAEHHCKSLQVTLNTLNQITTSFVMSFSQECLPWVQPAQPLVTELGPVCEEIMQQLDKLNMVFENLESSQRAYASVQSLSQRDFPTLSADPGGSHNSAVSALHQLTTTIRTLVNPTSTATATPAAV